MKKFLLTIIAFAAIFSLAACNGNDDEVIVETSEGDITKEDFYQELKTLYGNTVIQQLVDQKLLEANYDVSDEEVDEEFEKAKEPFQSEEEFEMALMQSQFADADEFREAIRLGLLQTKATTEGIEVNDEKLETFYNENKDMFVEVEASHILVDDEETAKEVKEKLDNGENFEDLVDEYSIDPGSASQGGAVGVVTKQSQMVPEFIDAALELEEGEISDIVISPQTGYHIIKATKRTVKTLEDDREEIEQQYLIQNARPFSEVRNELLRKSDIHVNDEQFEHLFIVEEPEEAESADEDAAGEGEESTETDYEENDDNDSDES